MSLKYEPASEPLHISVKYHGERSAHSRSGAGGQVAHLAPDGATALLAGVRGAGPKTPTRNLEI